jgi:hypothetical protein
MAKVVNGESRGRPGRWIVDFKNQNGRRQWDTYPTEEEAFFGSAGSSNHAWRLRRTSPQANREKHESI